MSRPKQHRENEDLYDINERIVDPRAFLGGTCSLWANKKKGAKQPVIYGNAIIPIRLIEFAKENTEPLFHDGERCISLSLSYWETNENSYYSDNPPVYKGQVKLYLKTLRKDVADHIRKAYRVLRGGN